MAKKNIGIKYTSRDFEAIKNDLIEYAKRYYPETFKDFNEAGFGSLMLDTVSYVGDILSFYLDYQTNESFLDTAEEYNNIIRHGKSLGYKFTGNPSSYGRAIFYVIVTSNAEGTGPDTDYLPVLKQNSEFASKSGVPFLLMEDVYFADSSNEIVVARVDSVTGIPTAYAIRAHGIVVSGKLKEEIITVGEYKKFLRLELQESDITEVISVVDAEGHSYYEVENLSQNIIYKPILNKSTTTKESALNLLRPFVVPRRFVVERERRKTYLQFGYGSEFETTNLAIAEPTSVMIQSCGKEFITDTGFDPNKLITTDKFGVAPANTTIRVVYRTNAAENVNLAVNALTAVVSPKFFFDNIDLLDSTKIQSVVSSLECDNEEPIVGDVSLPTSEEIKRRIIDSYATQNRAVTKQDYVALAYMMPAKYGSIKRVNIVKDLGSFKRNLNMYVVSEAQDSTLVETNDIIKENLRYWLLQNKMINDTIDIMSGRIVNLSIEFEAIGDLSRSKYDILNDAVLLLTTEYQTKKNFGEPFIITDIYDILKRVDGLVDVTKVKIKQKRGGSGNRQYSDVVFDINRHLSPDGRYIDCPSNVIFELKYPTQDIYGAIK